MKKPKPVRKETKAKSKRKNAYVPNIVPLKTRLFCLLGVALLMGYGLYGHVTNSLYVPTRGGRGLYLKDDAITVMYFALIAAAIGLISIIIDHYDKRNNELTYMSFQMISFCSAMGLFVLAVLTNIYSQLSA